MPKSTVCELQPPQIASQSIVKVINTPVNSSEVPASTTTKVPPAPPPPPPGLFKSAPAAPPPPPPGLFNSAPTAPPPPGAPPNFNASTPPHEIPNYIKKRSERAADVPLKKIPWATSIVSLDVISSELLLHLTYRFGQSN